MLPKWCLPHSAISVQCPLHFGFGDFVGLTLVSELVWLGRLLLGTAFSNYVVEGCLDIQLTM